MTTVRDGDIRVENACGGVEDLGRITAAVMNSNDIFNSAHREVSNSNTNGVGAVPMNTPSADGPSTANLQQRRGRLHDPHALSNKAIPSAAFGVQPPAAPANSVDAPSCAAVADIVTKRSFTSSCECVPFHVRVEGCIRAGPDHNLTIKLVKEVLAVKQWRYLYNSENPEFIVRISRFAMIFTFRVSLFLDKDTLNHVIEVADISRDREFPGVAPDVRGAIMEHVNPEQFRQRPVRLTAPTTLLAYEEVEISHPMKMDQLDQNFFICCGSCGDERHMGWKSAFPFLQDNKSMWREENVVERVKEAVVNAVEDPNFEVRECAVNLLVELCDEPEFANAFTMNGVPLLRKLLAMLEPLGEEEYFTRGDLFERSAQVVCKLAALHPHEVCVELSHAQFSSGMRWEQFCASFDKPWHEQLRHSLEEIAQVFSSPIPELGCDLNSMQLSSRPSPCEEAPSSSMHCPFVRANCAIYSELVASMKTFTGLLYEATCTYSESESCFKLGFMDGGNKRTVYLNIFWDSTVSDHVIEVRRVSGDAVFSGRDVHKALLQFLKEKKVDRLKVLPLPTDKRESYSEQERACIVEDVKRACAIAKSPYLETKIEGLKVITNLARVYSSKSALLEQAECVSALVDVLKETVVSLDKDVCVYGLVAIEMLCYIGLYQDTFMSPTVGVLPSLFRIVRDTNLSQHVYFENGQLVRKASRILMLFSLRNKVLYSQQLRDNFYLDNPRRWESFCARLKSYDPSVEKTMASLGC